MTYSPYSEFMLCNSPIQVHTHTHREHTPGAVGHMLRRPGSSCFAQGHLVVILKVERVLYIHSPNNNPCRTKTRTRLWVRLSTIRPRLPSNIYICMEQLSNNIWYICHAQFWSTHGIRKLYFLFSTHTLIDRTKDSQHVLWSCEWTCN